MTPLAKRSNDEPPDAISLGLAVARSERAPMAPFRRVLLFLVAMLILHGFCVFVAAQIVRSNPALVTGHPTLASLACGEGSELEADFRPARDGGSRGLNRWLVCRAPDGTVIEGAGDIAAIASGLVLSAPLGILLFGWVMRIGRRRPENTVRIERAGPARWFDRLAIAFAALLVATVVAGATAAYVTQYHAEPLSRSALAGRILCGEGGMAQVADRSSRTRNIVCVDASGQTLVMTPSPLFRLMLPVFLLIAVPGVAFALRARFTAGPGRPRRFRS